MVSDTEAPTLNSIELIGDTTYAPGDQIEISYSYEDDTGLRQAFFVFLTPSDSTLNIYTYEDFGAVNYTLPANLNTGIYQLQSVFFEGYSYSLQLSIMGHSRVCRVDDRCR